MPLYEFEGPAGLDERIFNTYSSPWGYPMVGVGESMRFSAVNDAVCCGPGAFVTTADPLERGFNAWFGAPGYMVGEPFVERHIQDPHPDLIYARAGTSPEIGVNPWDWMHGTFGSYGVHDGMGTRDWPSQEGRYSIS